MQRMFVILPIFTLAAIVARDALPVASQQVSSHEMFAKKYEALFGETPSGNAWIREGIRCELKCCGGAID